MSNGMICSHDELGIEPSRLGYEPEYGILVLDETSEIGSDVKDLFGLNENVVEFEITSNRPDCFSIIGLARETAATFKKPFNVPAPTFNETDGDINDMISVSISDPEKCMRYCARAVKNVKIGPSPKWMRERLEACGVRAINNIVDISKIESKLLSANFMNYDIINIVEELTLSVVEYALLKNINIQFDTNVEQHIIKCDASMIERVILNLLSNAIKFSDLNKNIFVNILVNEEWVEIEVIDEGIGIPDISKQIIFEKFVQADKSFTRMNEGSGIGLCIVEEIIKLHNGKIHVTSKVNEGTSFEIILPIYVVENSFKSAEIKDLNQSVKLEMSDVDTKN